MKKHLVAYICIIFSLCIILCSCNTKNSKYNDLIDAIEDEDYDTAESEFTALINEIVENQKKEEGITSSTSSNQQEITDYKIKTVGITTDNFFDYFYIEKITVPYIINSKKRGEIQMPAFITLKDKYKIAPRFSEKETHIAIEFNAKNTRRYALADYNIKQIKEIYEIEDYQNQELFTDTLTITTDRTSVYANGFPYGYNVSEQRTIHTILETFNLVRAIGTLYLIEE